MSASPTHLDTSLPPVLHGWRASVLLSLLVLTAYLGTSPAEFVYDDARAIRDNVAVNGPLPLSEIWTHDFWGLSGPASVGTYRPVTVLTLALNWRLGDGAPWAFRLVNVGWHLVAILAFFFVWSRIVGRRVALMAAGLAAVLAAPSEAVFYGVGRADVLCAIGATLGLHAHRTPGLRGTLGAVLGFLFALGSKETGSFVPAVWCAIDFLLSTPVSARHRMLRFAVYAAASVPYFFGRAHALGTILTTGAPQPLQNPLLSADRIGRLFGAGEVLATRYLAGIVDPWRRIADCSAQACGPSDVHAPMAWVGLAAALAMVMAPMLLRRRSPAAAAALFWFAVFLLPISNLLILGPTIYGERLLYVPIFGLTLAIAIASQALMTRITRPALVWGALAVIMLLNATAVRMRHPVWHDGESFLLERMRATPNNSIVWSDIAIRLNLEGDRTAAEEAARRSIAFSEANHWAHRELGSALFEMGRLDEAAESFERALKLSLDATTVHDYASLLGKRGEYERGLNLVQRYLRRRGQTPEIAKIQAKLERAIARTKQLAPSGTEEAIRAATQE